MILVFLQVLQLSKENKENDIYVVKLFENLKFKFKTKFCFIMLLKI